MISAANGTPTTVGGSFDDWLARELGNFWSEAQVWQESDMQVIAVFISREKSDAVQPFEVGAWKGGLV